MAHQDLDTQQKGTDGPFEPWEGDHTALVHVLWAAQRAGLTLAGDADEIASMILRSRALAARTAAARADAVERQAEQYDREAAAIRQRLEAEDLPSDDANLLDHNASTLERLARAARAEATQPGR